MGYTAEEEAFTGAAAKFAAARVLWTEKKSTYEAKIQTEKTTKQAALAIFTNSEHAAISAFEAAKLTNEEALEAAKEEFKKADQSHQASVESIKRVLEILDGLRA